MKSLQRSKQQKKSIKLFDKSTQIPSTKKISVPILKKQKVTFFSNQAPINFFNGRNGK